MAKWGIPYMGSKDKIAENICKVFPPATHFYDLFGGGFSITHCMLNKRSKSYKHFHFNEIRKGIPSLIKDAINGKYNYDSFLPEWISRKDFFEKKELDPYIKIIWSFGNNGKGYIFGKDIEAYKKSIHNAVVFNDFNSTARDVLGIEKFRNSYGIKDRRLFAREQVRVKHKGKKDGELRRLQQLQQLERLEQLQQLEQLERLQQLNFYNGDYKDVKIENDSVVYCDIPYKGTANYNTDKAKVFNHNEFYEWVRSQSNPIFISEYDIKEEGFYFIGAVEKRSMLSGNKKKCLNKIEKLYGNKTALEIMREYSQLKPRQMAQ